MIVLDTNVISEPLKPRPDERVLSWLDNQDSTTLFLSIVTIAELRYGLEVMPAGRKRGQIFEAFEQGILTAFEGRILPLDMAATTAYGRLRARAKARGKAIATADGYIAATAAARGFAVATRDRGPFEAAGLPVVDPWDAAM